LGAHVIERAALGAEGLARSQWIDLDRRATSLAFGAQIIETFEPAAFTLPVADLVLDEVERRSATKIRDGEHRFEYGLQTGALPFFREKVHLQKTIVGFALDLDQIRDPNGGRNFGKVHAFRRATRPPT